MPQYELDDKEIAIYKQEGLVLKEGETPKLDTLNQFLSKISLGESGTQKAIENFSEPPRSNKTGQIFTFYNPENVTIIIIHRPANMYYLSLEPDYKGHPPITRWEVKRFNTGKLKLPFLEASRITTVGVEIEGPSSASKGLPKNLQKELQRTMTEIPVPPEATALGALYTMRDQIELYAKNFRPAPESWTQHSLTEEPNFFEINDGVFAEYVRLIQKVLFYMIPPNDTLAIKDKHPASRALKYWRSIAKHMGFNDLNELLEFASNSGIDLGFLYFSALHVHVAVPTERRYPISIAFEVAKAINNPLLASSLLLTTASTPAAYGLFLETEDKGKKLHTIDARYTLAQILPTTQRFPALGYATNLEEFKEILYKNTAVKGANTIDRMMGYNDDLKTPIMHGMMRIRPHLGTIEFTGASATDPFASTIYMMMTELLVTGALMGIDATQFFEELIPGTRSDLPIHWQKELFFQDLITIPTNINELRAKINLIKNMQNAWSRFFEALKAKIAKEETERTGIKTPDELEIQQTEKGYTFWYMEQIKTNFSRIIDGFVLAYATLNEIQLDELKTELEYELTNEAQAFYNLVVDKENHHTPQELMNNWMEYYPVPIWTVWYLLHYEQGLSAKEIEQLLHDNILDLYQNAVDFMRKSYIRFLQNVDTQIDSTA